MLVPPNIHKYRDSSDCINRQTKSPTQLLTNTYLFIVIHLHEHFLPSNFLQKGNLPTRSSNGTLIVFIPPLLLQFLFSSVQHAQSFPLFISPPMLLIMLYPFSASPISSSSSLQTSKAVLTSASLDKQRVY